MYLAVMEALRIGHFIEEMFKLKVWPIEVFGDNKSSIQIVNGTTGATATKYLATKFYLLQELAQEQKIKVEYVNTNVNRSDGMTKPLRNTKFKLLQKYCFEYMGFLDEQETGNVSAFNSNMVGCENRVSGNKAYNTNKEVETISEGRTGCLLKDENQ